jgi:hypothetical protein
MQQTHPSTHGTSRFRWVGRANGEKAASWLGIEGKRSAGEGERGRGAYIYRCIYTYVYIYVCMYGWVNVYMYVIQQAAGSCYISSLDSSSMYVCIST